MGKKRSFSPSSLLKKGEDVTPHHRERGGGKNPLNLILERGEGGEIFSREEEKRKEFFSLFVEWGKGKKEVRI